MEMKKSSLNELDWKDRYTYVKDIPFNEDDLCCKGAKFQIVKFKPRTSIKPHYHKKTIEIFYIRSGTGVLRLNDVEFRCKQDDFFLCEPGDVHEFINDTDSDFVILIFKTNEEENTDMCWK
jgi:quercetin dioxygenase-like cupin family protein